MLALVFTFLQLGIVSALTYFKLAPWARAYIKAVGDAPYEAWPAKDPLLVAALTNRGMAVSVLLGGALLVGVLSLPQALAGAAATSSLPLSVPVLAALIPAALVDWRVQHLPTRLLSVAGAVLLLGMVLAWLGPQVASAGIDDVAAPLRAGDLRCEFVCGTGAAVGFARLEHPANGLVFRFFLWWPGGTGFAT